MNIVLTFTNIACCTYIVAICRTLNEILLKLTTQLHSHKGYIYTNTEELFCYLEYRRSITLLKRVHIHFHLSLRCMHSLEVNLFIENEEIFTGRFTAVEEERCLRSRLRSWLYMYKYLVRK